jgi:cytochrome c
MFLGGPQKWVKGTKMTFIGVKKPEDRINLIAYLRTQGSSGYPIPAPKPAAAASASGSASAAAGSSVAASK